MSSWEEYKKKHKITQNKIQLDNSSYSNEYSPSNSVSQSGTSSWQKYKKEMEEKEKRRAEKKVEKEKQESIQKAEEEQRKKTVQEIAKETSNNITNGPSTNNLKTRSGQSFEERKNNAKVDNNSLVKQLKETSDKTVNNVNNKEPLVSLKNTEETTLDAIKINEDIKNGNYNSAIQHIITGVPAGISKGIGDVANAGLGLVAYNYRLNNKALDSFIDKTSGENEKNSNFALNSIKKLRDFYGNSSEQLLNVADDIHDNTSKYGITNAHIDNGFIRTAGNVSSGVGNMLPSIATNIVLPGSGIFVTGAQSMGDSVMETLNDEKNNLGKSLLTGAVKGTVSMGVEKLAGGNLITKGGFDEVVAKGLKNKVKSKLSQELLYKGYQVVGEMAEEQLENEAGYIIDKIINDKDMPDLKQRWEDASETAKITSLTTIALNLIGLGGGSIDSIDTSNLSQQDKNTIQQIIKVANDKNIISDFKNESLNSNINKNNIDSQQTTLNQTKMAQNQNMSQIEQNNIKLPMRELSYVESARKYNIDTNNETVQSIARVTNERNLKASYNSDMFTNNNQNAIWRISTDENGNTTREVILNPNADTNKTLQNVIVHELTHDMEGTKQYNELKDIILKYDKTKIGYEDARKNLEEIYSEVYDVNSNEFKTLVDNEAVADILGNKLGDQDFINNLTKENRTVGQKIYDWVVDKLNKLNAKVGYKSEKLYWADVKNKFENAFKQEYNNTNINQARFSIQQDENGNKYVKVDIDQDIFDGKSPKEYPNIIKKYILEQYRDGSKQIKLPTKDNVNVTSKTANEYSYPKNRLPHLEKNSKMKAGTELNNLLAVSEYQYSSKDDGRHSFAKDGWDYYKTTFEVNGERFEGLINIAKDGNRKMLYDITKIKKMSHYSTSDKSFSASLRPSSTNSIPPTRSGVNTNSKIRFTGISSVSTNSQHKTDSINNSIAPTKSDVNTTNKYSMQESENNSWNKYLETNYKSTGKGETIKEVKLPITKQVENVSNSSIENKNKTNLDLYNKYKKNIIKNKETAINTLIQYKNETTTNLDNVIAEKQALLDSKTNKDTKSASILKSQIENLKSRKTEIENLYNEKIDKFNSKIDKKKIELETRNAMKKIARDNLSAEVSPLVEDLTKYKDKKAGILFNRETAQRNIDDIVKDKTLANSIKETIFDPVQVHQAEKTREINSIYEKINSLNLDKSKKYYYIPDKEITGVKVDEATLAQLIIEKKISDTDLRNYGLNDSGIKKIHDTANVFTEILDDLYNRMNEEQIKYGYSPIGKIKNYFPHFIENKADSMLGKLASRFGIDLSNQNLPTEIAGKTDTFKPGKTWNSNIQKRRTNKTDYDALVAMEKYIQGATDIIYTTEDIQRVREYSREIRYKFSDKGIQDEIDKITNNIELTQEAKDLALEGIFKNTENELSNFVTWLDDYANTLANKKSFADRNMERNIGRNMYNSMSGIESRIAANTIGGNLSVSFTNFAPIFQAAGTTKWNYLITGMLQTTSNDVKGIIGNKDVSFIDNSNFLTNRFGTDSISQKKVSQKVSNFLSMPMESIDEFTSESIVRAKYLENIDKGMSEDVALDNADKYAAKIMADRSKGALPIVFNTKNPISKLLTMFQVEPNNIVSNYLKDMPRDSGSKVTLTAQATKLMVASYAFNSLIMAVRGGNEVLPDPIRWVSYLIKAITGDDEEKEKAKTDLTESVIGSLPFVSNLGGFIGLEDIGRVPISNAMPDLSVIGKLVDSEADDKYKSESFWKEAVKPLLYLGLPVGGAQLKKTIEGISTVVNGGSYKTNKEGEKELQFAVENPNVLDYVKAGIFGKYSLADSKLYADRGYKSLSSKQTQIYEESGLPYKEYLEYLDQKLTKKEDKLKYLNSKNWTTEQKWGIYKNDILSNTIRKEDGGSQRSDAEYMIKNGVSKSEFIKLYNNAQQNDIEIPTKDEYKKMKDSGLNLKEYVDYSLKVKEETKLKRQDGQLTENQSLKDKDKIQILLDSDYSDEQKTAIYENYILSKTNTTYSLLKQTGIDINEYMKYTQQEFEAEKIDDGTTTGKTISGSSKRKVYDYVNSMNISYEQRLVLLGLRYTLSDNEQTNLYNYVRSLNYTEDEMKDLFDKLKGFTVYKDGRITW